MAIEVRRRVVEPDRGRPAALAAVTVYAALPWIAALAHALESGTFALEELFIGCVAVWFVLPASFVSIAELPRQRWFSASIWYAAVGLGSFVVLAIAVQNRSADPQPFGSTVTAFAGAWAVLLVAAMGIGALCVATEPVFRSLAGRRPLKPFDEAAESWRKAFVAGVASCVLVGPAVWAAWAEVAAAATSAFVVGLNVVAWVLRHGPADQVFKWVVVLAVPALIAVVAGPSTTAIWIVMIGLAYSSALGALCSRSSAAAVH